MSKQYKVGLWASREKIKKLRLETLSTVARQSNIDFEILINDDCQLKSELRHVHFDLVLHKLVDSSLSISQINESIDNFRLFAADNPTTILPDNFESTLKLLNRMDACKLAVEVFENISVKLSCLNTVVLNKSFSDAAQDLDSFLHRNGLQFPLICKPFGALDTFGAHDMTIVFNSNQLRHYFERSQSSQCVVQRFINHDACLYKICPIGRDIFICRRPSVKNFYPSTYPEEMINFKTSQVSKSSSKSDLNGIMGEQISLDDKVVRKLVAEFAKQTKMTFFGIDLIVCSQSGRYFIIDVNHFPGYNDLFLNFSPEFVSEKFVGLLGNILHESDAPSFSPDEFEIYEMYICT